MGLQTTVNFGTGFGSPGDIIRESPWRADAQRLASASNVIGTAFFFVATGDAVASDKATGAGAFAGILASSKEYALYGTQAGGPLAPTLILPTGTIGELLLEGEIIVLLPAAAAIGDIVYAKDDGSGFVTAAPTAAVPASTRPINATVSRFPVTAAGLAVIHVDGPSAQKVGA